jgi:PAS domain S-box-containing protein
MSELGTTPQERGSDPVSGSSSQIAQNEMRFDRAHNPTSSARTDGVAGVWHNAADILDLFENGAVALHLVAADGTIKIANQAELDLLGFSREEYVGRNIREFHADQDAISEILARLSAGEKVDKFPARLIAKDGSIRHVLVTSNVQFKDGEFVHSRCFTSDVTAAKVAQAELDAQNRRLEATFENAAIGIAETDADGRFIRVNQAMSSLTGYCRDELLEQTLFYHLHPDDQENTKADYARLVSGELASYEIDKRFIHKSGQAIWLNGTCKAVRDDDGNFLFAVRVVRDETIRKTLYQLTEGLNAAVDLDAVYGHALAAITNVLRCRRASVLLFDDAKMMKFVAFCGLSEAYREAVEGHSPWTPETKDPSPVLVSDIEAADLPSNLKSAIRDEGIGAVAFFPLTIDGVVVGKFMAYFDGPREFKHDDQWPGLTIARQMSLAIARINAVRALERSSARISADAEALRRLNSASMRLWRCANLAEGLDAILEGAIETMGASMGNVQLRDPEREVLRIAAQRGFNQPFLDFFAEVSSADRSACGRALSSGERIIVADVEADPDFVPMRDVAREAGFRAVQSTPLLGRSGTALGMLSTHFSDVHTPTQYELRRLDLYARQAADFIEHCRMEEALKESEARERARATELEAIMESVPAPIWLTKDSTCETVTGNRAAEQLLGLPPGTNHSFSVSDGQRPTNFELCSEGRKLDTAELPIQRAARGEEIQNLELELRFTDGYSRTLLGNAAPLRGTDGKLFGSVAAFVDITERLRAEKQRALLVAELSHRVKNTLATVFALWQHTCAKAETLDAAKRSFETRLLALSQTHSRLAEADWSGVRLNALIEDELRPYLSEDGQNVVVRGEDIILNSRAALTLGLALHELATNAAKYGALSRSEGRVSVSWAIDGGVFSFEWKEDGGPAVSAPLRRGFGRFLIERGLAADFAGNVDLNFNVGGVTCRMAAPLESLLVEAAQA